MSKVARLGLAVAIVALLVIGFGGSISAQQGRAGAPDGMNQAAIQRSQSVVAELARIEGNKEAYVDELLGRWAPFVDNGVDLWGTVKGTAMAATPWRLLGASLTTDFESGFRVLRGVVGPGWYISAYIEGRPVSFGAGAVQAAGVPDPGQDALGSSTDSLVFTPIAPCRILDTRGTGARTGMIPAFTAKSFDFTTAAFAEGQGGATSCPGLPSAQQAAWAVNVTATGYTSIGHIIVFPRSATSIPTVSFLNYFPTAYAIANAGTVTGCTTCGDSVWIYSYAPSHVIVDVTGYYSEATGFAGGAVTQLWSDSATIVANAFISIDSPTCPAGTTMISGGMRNDSGGQILLSDTKPYGSGWRVWVKNTSGTYSYTAAANINCMDVQ